MKHNRKSPLGSQNSANPSLSKTQPTTERGIGFQPVILSLSPVLDRLEAYPTCGTYFLHPLHIQQRFTMNTPLHRTRVSAIATACWLVLALGLRPTCHAQTMEAGQAPSIFAPDQLVAWCIVPFDAKKRTPAERAEMLKKLGLTKLAYDYRAEHIASFDEEMLQLKKHNIDLFAWWFPTTLNDEAKLILDVLRRHNIKAQLWVTGGGGPVSNEEEQRQRVVAEAERIRAIALAAQEIGCEVALYNHGGWFGEPENQIAIIEHMKLPNVGIVYNLHHGHAHLTRFPELLAKMKPHLMALNLNGMVIGGDANGNKIMPLGTGTLDRALLKAIVDSGYQGPIGILNHTDHDAEARLLDNLDGLEWLLKSNDQDAPFPTYRTWNGPRPVDEDLVSWSEAERAAIESLSQTSLKSGQADRGVAVFASAKNACLSCHKIGKLGGGLGPELTNLGRERSIEQITESLLYPNKTVDAKYRVYQMVTADQQIIRGFKTREDEHGIDIRDPATGKEQSIAKDDIEQIRPAPSLMPEGLADGMSAEQLSDLVSFLADLGVHQRLRSEIAMSVLEHAQPHAPAEFPFVRDPIDEQAWPNWQAHVNRNRVYDFYTKQANYFRGLDRVEHLLPPYLGLDTGAYGHWGNQNEQTWANEAWNRTTLGSVQSGVFHGGDGLVVPRGICVQLGEQKELAVCFNPDTATYEATWRDGFLQFSSFRHGFMNGLSPKGKVERLVKHERPAGPVTYQGLYRYGDRVIFAYKVGEISYLDSPWVENGKFVSVVTPRDQHPMKDWLTGGEPQWPQEIVTKIKLGDESPYAIDTIELPWDNPWNAPIFCGDHDFLPDGSVLVCTMQGDVWHGKGVSMANNGEQPVIWRRFAAGLHHALGLKVTSQGIFVLGRDQITRLHDLNQDGEADFYECFSNAYETSAAGHDFICGLQQDAQGNFYIASGNQGIVRISPDGKSATVIAEGFRNPDGLGIHPDGFITVPCSEGEWTPTSMICRVPTEPHEPIPFYGYRGAKFTQRPIEKPVLPLAYIPRGLDNSAGGQVYVDSDRWGPLAGQMIHLSFGAGSHFLLLQDEVEGVAQGAIVPLRGEFRSGVHRGRFNAVDGQLYVSGMGGWGTYTTDFGCLQRVRYTGTPVQLPVSIRAHQNGVAIRFSEKLDRKVAEDVQAHFAQSWNYRYSAAYGSAEYSPSQYGTRGHDLVMIQSAHVSDDGQTLFLEIPDLQPVNQLHLQVSVAEAKSIDMFVTCHRLAAPRTDIAGYVAREKTIGQHPIELDLAMAARKVANPWKPAIEGARKVKMVAGKNLTFETASFTAKRGEAIALTLVNPDVVPHNWALVKPNKLETVGNEANKLVADPEALIRQYAPQTDDVICYTDIVEPGQSFTIHFRVPDHPGRYPYLCTFPGHWMVMNGEMVVE
jgi:putative heme-binding domain-containing protein